MKRIITYITVLLIIVTSMGCADKTLDLINNTPSTPVSHTSEPTLMEKVQTSEPTDTATSPSTNSAAPDEMQVITGEPIPDMLRAEWYE